MANIIRRQDPFAGGIAPPLSVRDPLDFITPVFDRIFGGQGSDTRLDIREIDQAYVLDMEIPGTEKNAISVSVYNDTVTIEAERREEKDANQEYKWLYRERSYGKISRTVALPEELDEEKSSARFDNGVLYLTLPKKRANSSKRLAIN